MEELSFFTLVTPEFMNQTVCDVPVCNLPRTFIATDQKPSFLKLNFEQKFFIFK